MIFLEILGTVESSLRQLAALVRYSLPVRLTHHKTNSALSICILLLFKISPANLEEESKWDVALWSWRRILELTYFNNINEGNSEILLSPWAWNSTWLFHVQTLTGSRSWHSATQSCFGVVKFVGWTALFNFCQRAPIDFRKRTATALRCSKENLPFSFPVRTCVWRSRLAAGGSDPGLPYPHVSSSHFLPAHPACLYKSKITV